MNPAVADALRRAAQLLARRDLSVAGLRQQLLDSGHTEEDTDAAVEWLADHRFVDDHGVAGRETEKALHSRGWGRLRLEARLETLEVSDEAASAALAQIDPETEKSLAAVALAKRFKAEIDAPRAARFLAGRGFSEDAIRSALDASVPGWEERT